MASFKCPAQISSILSYSAVPFRVISHSNPCFVSRLKDTSSHEVVETRELPVNRNILSDEIIIFTGYPARKDCPIPLRRIVVWDTENEKENILS